MLSGLYKVKTLLFILIVFSQINYAYAYQENQLLPQMGDGYIVLQAGGFRTVAGKQNNFYNRDESKITIIARNNGDDNANALVGAGLYANTSCYGEFQFSFGVNAFYLGNVSVKGTLYESFENIGAPVFNYKYDIRNIPVYFILKAKTFKFSRDYPLSVDLGIGPNIMRILKYQEYNLDGSTADTPTFYARGTVAPTATLGISFEFPEVIEGASFSVGYRLFVFGKGKLQPYNTYNTIEMNNNLTTGYFHANALVLSVMF